MDPNSIIYFLIQISIGIVITVIVYIISLFVMNSDGLDTTSALSQGMQSKTTILDGIIDASDIKKRVFNTVLPGGGAVYPYLNIRRSVNRHGGAQYTYSFWMYVNNLAYIHDNKSICNLPKGEDANNFENYRASENPDLYVLFLKGDSRCYHYQTQAFDQTLDKTIGEATEHRGRFVMSPMVAIGDPVKRELKVFFNTLDKVNQSITLSRNPNYDATLRRNITSLTEGSWVMYTFVLMDFVPINDFESGIVVKSYVNDTLYQMDKISGTLQDNEGEFSLLPDGAPGANTSTSTRLLMSSLDYYNYALSDAQVQARFNAGFNANPNSDVENQKYNKLQLSAYNKLDSYNL